MLHGAGHCWARDVGGGPGSTAPVTGKVRKLRVVVTTDDYEEAVVFYRDALGLTPAEAHESEDGRVMILDAGRATLEIADPAQAEFIDRVEVGRRVAGHIRIAFEVDDAREATDRAVRAGASLVAQPVVTPWNSLNSRLQGPGDIQLTLFQELEPSR